MREFLRQADDRRVFTTELERSVVQQMGKGEQALAHGGRGLNVCLGILRGWLRWSEAGAGPAAKANEGVAPVTRRTVMECSSFAAEAAP